MCTSAAGYAEMHMSNPCTLPLHLCHVSMRVTTRAHYKPIVTYRFYTSLEEHFKINVQGVPTCSAVV